MEERRRSDGVNRDENLRRKSLSKKTDIALMTARRLVREGIKISEEEAKAIKKTMEDKSQSSHDSSYNIDNVKEATYLMDFRFNDENFATLLENIKVTKKGRTRRKSEAAPSNNKILRSKISFRDTEIEHGATILMPLSHSFIYKDENNVGHVRRLSEILDEQKTIDSGMIDSGTSSISREDGEEAFATKKKKSFIYNNIPRSPKYLANIGIFNLSNNDHRTDGTFSLTEKEESKDDSRRRESLLPKEKHLLTGPFGSSNSSSMEETKTNLFTILNDDSKLRLSNPSFSPRYLEKISNAPIPQNNILKSTQKETDILPLREFEKRKSFVLEPISNDFNASSHRHK